MAPPNRRAPMSPVAKHRQAKGWTQTELARMVGVHLTTVQEWEERSAWPRPKRIARLAELFDMKGEDLLEELDAVVKKALES